MRLDQSAADEQEEADAAAAAEATAAAQQGAAAAAGGSSSSGTSGGGETTGAAAGGAAYSSLLYSAAASAASRVGGAVQGIAGAAIGLARGAVGGGPRSSSVYVRQAAASRRELPERAAVLALAHCYLARLESGAQREGYLAALARELRRHRVGIFLSGTEGVAVARLRAIIDDEQNDLLGRMARACATPDKDSCAGVSALPKCLP